MSIETKLNSVFDYNSSQGFKRSLKIFFRILYTSFVRFYRDDCLMQASAVSYTTIISLVPMLTVALALVTITSGFGDKQDAIFDEITTFLQKNELKIDISPYLENLKEIISSATQIGSVGFIVLIFSATAILRSFEASFNKIWKIETPRPFADKIIFYFFILSIGPLLFAVLFGFAGNFSEKLRNSHLYSVTRDNLNYIWIAGERGTLIKTDDTGKKISKLSDLKIDFENMICFDLEKNEILRSCETPRLNRETFIKIRNKNKTLVAISESGILLQATEGDEFWKIVTFANSKFKDFTIIDEKTFLILNESGTVFKFQDLSRSEFIVLKVNTEIPPASRVRFYDNSLGFILDESGNVWISRDSGKTFLPQKVSDTKLDDIAILNRESYVVVGEKGGIFKSFDGGKTWKDVSHKNINFIKIWNLKDENKEILLILNSFDHILRSEDLGENWTITYTPENGALLGLVPINPRFGFKALNPEDDETEEAVKELDTTAQAGTVKGDILAVGEFGKISIGELKEDRVVFKGVSGGEAIFSFYSIIKFSVPLLGVWLFFIMLYTLIPNTKVPIKPAVVGALITSIIFLLFLYGFGVYIRSFSGSTFMIYRALAAIPLFLLGVYSVSVIILLGAELTATLQYRDRYLNDHIFLERESFSGYPLYHSIRLLALIYDYQKREKKLPSEEKIKFKLGASQDEFGFIKKKLIGSGILMVTESGTMVPNRSSEDLSLLDVYRSILGEAYIIPRLSEDLGLEEQLKKSFSGIQEFIDTNMGSKNMKEILKGA